MLVQKELRNKTGLEYLKSEIILETYHSFVTFGPLNLVTYYLSLQIF